MKVLVIDDSVEALAIAKVRLGKEGLDVVCAGGGREGLDAAEKEAPDLILLDLDMPDMSGFNVCRALKANADLCMIPVIFLTGSGTDQDKVKGLDLGAVDYVTKPFDEFELRARVRVALRTKHLQDILIEYAQRDPLTGLHNRRALMEQMQREWARIQRSEGSLAFVMIDLDHFKYINDAHGHQTGDHVLQEVGRAIAGQCRGSDMAARYGGEEFAVLCPDAVAEGAGVLAERCRAAVAAVRLDLPSEGIRLTASFGVADSRRTDRPEDVIKKADEALYHAKQAGRNRVVTAESPAELALANDSD